MQRIVGKRRSALVPADAEAIGLRALQYLAETDALTGFCGESGVALSSLARRAAEPDLLGAVLDFVLADDSRLADFCTWSDLPHTTLFAARRLLPGAPIDS